MLENTRTRSGYIVLRHQYVRKYPYTFWL